MKLTKRMLTRLACEEQGQDLSEYALLVVLLTMIGILSFKVLGQAASNLFSNSAIKVAAT